MWTVTPQRGEEKAEARIMVPAKPMPALNNRIGHRQRPPAFREEPFIDPDLAWAVTG
jgi:hypothetical protein